MFFSGFMFPIASMPPLVQKLTYIVPLRYYIAIVRGIFLKGVGIEILWQQFLALLVLGSVILWFAVNRFRKTL
jgi:ABC-2 type transport system permease protein